MNETSYCDDCFASTTGMTVTDFTDNPFARCDACGTTADDAGALILAVWDAA